MAQQIGIYQITINPEADVAAFENQMKNEVFRTVNVGRQTRGGIVTAQYLVKEDSPEGGNRYSWIVHWTNQGGSPFGAANAPDDPIDSLAEFGAKTVFTRYEVLGQS